MQGGAKLICLSETEPLAGSCGFGGFIFGPAKVVFDADVDKVERFPLQMLDDSFKFQNLSILYLKF